MNETEFLTELKDKVLDRLKDMSKPIVRVCGPLTTGGLGYEENARRLKVSEEILTKKGFTVFRFGDAEESIKDMGFSHAAIMDIFHKPVLESGLISEAFFLKGWNESKGVSIEREICERIESILINDFPEEWFNEA